MAKTFFRTKKVGSPCDSFSIVSGSAKQIRRTRSICFSPGSRFSSFAIRFVGRLLNLPLNLVLTLYANKLDQVPQIFHGLHAGQRSLAVCDESRHSADA